MRMLRAILAGAMLVTAGQSVAAAGDDADWQLFGRVLSLVQSVAHVAAQSNDPRAVERQVEHLLSGRNTEANRLAGDLIGDAFEDMPARYRGTVLALANDFAAIARKDRARARADLYRALITIHTLLGDMSATAPSFFQGVRQ